MLMRVLSLDEFLEEPSHPMDWLVAPPSFKTNAMSALAAAYAQTDELPSGLSGMLKGGHRHTEGNGALVRAFSWLGAYPRTVRGQQRIFINDPRGHQYQLVIRRANWTPYGFETGQCGPVIEQFSFLSESSLQNDTGEPMTSGALFLHRHAPLQPGHTEAWFVPEWRSPEGATMIECPLAVSLGSARFKQGPDDHIEPEGETPEL